ncbi:YihY/virulence factor BrkB family protein [Paeniglutamicibacter gangotriensis]|uniref:Inner membrane protein yhjD n=1 Tax=Paeniglutamicibacter gangotriensis Lz1y TaxID=1276920 RepID=M7MST0_9MICC|nr:YihY/virulence factor BrkB family protein [Paeniglutamicibacter gangotriensis]EMQ99472.1 Inner membrane protein yhjD [Paeniglutamicibacter gangotriensis Lz1y]
MAGRRAKRPRTVLSTASGAASPDVAAESSVDRVASELGTRAPGLVARRFIGAPVDAPASPLDPRALHAFIRVKTQELYVARATGTPWQRLKAFFIMLTAMFYALYPMRVWNLYVRRRGPLLAAGGAYRMFFSIAAMLVAGFALLGMFVYDNPVLRDGIIEMVAASTPGLIDTGQGGLAKPEDLLGLGGFGATLAISLGALVFTSLGWLTGLREGIRTVFGLHRDRSNPVISKLRDALLLLVLAVALVVSSGLAVVSSSMIDSLGHLLNLDGWWTSALSRIGFIVAMFALDCATAWVLLRVASRVTVIAGGLVAGVLLAGAGATILRFLSATLLASLSNNVVLAPFAVILGLFVWFNLLSQTYLLSAAIVAVRSADVERVRAQKQERSVGGKRRRA